MQGRRTWWRKKCLHHGGRWQGWQFSAPKDKGWLVTFSKPDPPALSSNTVREFSFAGRSARSLIKSAKIYTYFEATEWKFPTQVSVISYTSCTKRCLPTLTTQPCYACWQGGLCQSTREIPYQPGQPQPAAKLLTDKAQVGNDFFFRLLAPKMQCRLCSINHLQFFFCSLWWMKHCPIADFTFKKHRGAAAFKFFWSYFFSWLKCSWMLLFSRQCWYD